MTTSFYTQSEINRLGFKYIGKNVKISRKASFYNKKTISIGDFSRIDDFCILSGEIEIGRYVHISAYCGLYGSKKIEINDYAGISANSIIYSAMDDFSGNFMVGPEVPNNLTNITGGKVIISKFAQIGVSNVIFPNIMVGEGAATGAMSLIKENLKEWNIYVGIPAKLLKARNKNIKLLEKKVNEPNKI